MSTELLDQLGAYGVWLEQSCATALRPPPASAVAEAADVDVDDAPEVEVGPRSKVSKGRRLMLAAAVFVVVASAVAALWAHRSETTAPVAPTPPSGLPADPNGPLFVLPPADSPAVARSDAVIWTGLNDTAPTAAVNAMVVGRPDGNAFVDIIGITDSPDRPGPDRPDAYTQIETSTGPALISSGAGHRVIQQRGERWIGLNNLPDTQNVAALLEAITLTPEGIKYEPVAGLVVVSAIINEPQPVPNTVFNAAFTDGTARFTVSTATASSPLLAALDFTERLEPITVNGHEAWLVSSRSDGGSTHGVMWQATPNRIVGVSGNATDQQLIDFAQSLRIVDEETWTTAMPFYSRQGP